MLSVIILCGFFPVTSAADSWGLPPAQGVFDYQLGGIHDTLPTPEGDLPIDVVVRDSTDRPLVGAYSICYVNGFQSQPGEADRWLRQPGALLRENGVPVTDPEWPDEYVLDPSTPQQRALILDVMLPVIDTCANAGFNAVEIDNVDTFTRFPRIFQTGALELARTYIDHAHARGMAVAQKNTAEYAAMGAHDLGFDFAIAEECAAYEECDLYMDAYGEHVLQIEYPDALDEADMTFADVCHMPRRAPLTILRDRGLVAPSETGWIYAACDAG